MLPAKGRTLTLEVKDGKPAVSGLCLGLGLGGCIWSPTPGYARLLVPTEGLFTPILLVSPFQLQSRDIGNIPLMICKMYTFMLDPQKL